MTEFAGRTVLTVMAHPDDAELTCAGAVAKWARQGAQCFLLVATDGARGGKTLDRSMQTVAEERRTEQRAAAAITGYKDVIFLGFRDGDVEDSVEMRRALVEAIRRIRPDLVVLMDPATLIYKDYHFNHRDHRKLGYATLDAMYPQSSNEFFFPEQIESGLRLHRVGEVLLANSDAANHYVDITGTIDARFTALREHRSQMALWPDGGEAIVTQQRAVAAAIGLRHGVAYAEEYRRIVINPLA